MNFQLLDLTQALREIGRGVVMYAENRWNGTANLALTHLADSEGDITVELNTAFTTLETPELTGAGKHKAFVDGEDPVITMPLFFADPALRAIASPTGNASGGYTRRRPVKERTLVIFPEELFYDEEGTEYKTLSYDGTDWELGGEELTARQEQLLGVSLWLWRGYFLKPGTPFRHDEAGKTVVPVQFQVMLSDLPLATIPEGERLYTIGDPADKLIDIHPVAP